MRYAMLKIVPILVMLVLGAPLVASQTWGDIVENTEARSTPLLFQKSGERVGSETPLRVQCWQFGREIIDQSDLHSMSLKPLLEQESVSFKRKGTEGVAVHILSVEDTVCMVQATP